MFQKDQLPTPLNTPLPKETVISKNGRSIRIISCDLTPFVGPSGFVDPDFPHVLSSLTGAQQQMQIQENPTVAWLPAEQLSTAPTFAQQITSLEQPLFRRDAISHALALVNWFANPTCSELLSQEVSPHGLYRFDVLKQGLFTSVAIDSYVPVKAGSKTELFSKPHKGSIFPCLYEKMLAKVYGSYEAIPEDFLDIFELQTGFCREEISLTRGITSRELQEVLQRRIEEGSLACFRTRNSIRLESLGLRSNHLYVVLRVVETEEGALVEFLELEGEQWIGRMSKIRSEWLLESALVREKKIVLGSSYRENYMQLSDLQGLGRELVVLNCTQKCHKNHFSCESGSSVLTMYRLSLSSRDRVRLRTNYKRIQCYNSLFLISQHRSQDQLLAYSLVGSCFREHRDSCYLEAELEPGEYFLVVYNWHSQQHSLPYNLTLFSEQQFVQIVPLPSLQDAVEVLSQAFLSQLKPLKPEQQSVLFKHMYPTTGLAFIYASSARSPLQITIDRPLLEQAKIFRLTHEEDENEQTVTENVGRQEERVMVFRCLWSRRENIAFDYSTNSEVQKVTFPPIGSTKVVEKRSL